MITPYARALLAAATGTAYLLTIVAANIATDQLGVVDLHLAGLEVTAGTFAAGLAFTYRDAVHEALQGRRWPILLLILGGALLSWVLADGRLALASGVAFTAAELADWATYERLRARILVAVGVSGLVGAVVDTALFLPIADFPVTVDVVAGQLLVKVAAVTGVMLALTWAARRLTDR